MCSYAISFGTPVAFAVPTHMFHLCGFLWDRSNLVTISCHWNACTVSGKTASRLRPPKKKYPTFPEARSWSQSGEPPWGCVCTLELPEAVLCVGKVWNAMKLNFGYEKMLVYTIQKTVCWKRATKLLCRHVFLQRDYYFFFSYIRSRHSF